MRGTVARLLLACLVVLGASVAATASASAHAELLDSTPRQGATLSAAPSAAEMRFSEPVTVIGHTVTLLGPGSERQLSASVADGTVHVPLPDQLPNGRYGLAFRVLSADGHPVGGVLAFQIGTAESAGPVGTPATDDAGTEALFAALNVVQYLGLLTFGGLLFFGRVIHRRSTPPMPRLAQASLLTAWAAATLLVPIGALRVTGQPWWRWDTDWFDGLQWQPVVAALVVGLAGAVALVLSREGRGGAALAVAGAAVATPMLVGHTQAVQPSWLMIGADCVHLAAGAVWLGGVVGLAAALVNSRRAGADPAESARLVTRFSNVGLLTVLGLALSGGVMAVLTVGSLPALIDTGYGRLLLLKLAVLAPAIALAAWNRFALLPQIRREPFGPRGWLRLIRLLRREAGVLLAVVAVTAVLTNTAPAKAASDGAAQPQASAPTTAPLRATSQGLAVAGELTPASVGDNELTFTLSYRGRKLTTGAVAVSARMPERDIGPITTTATFDPERGCFRARLAVPVAGAWRLQVAVRADQYTRPLAIVEVQIA